MCQKSYRNMSAKKLSDNLRTWIEIDSRAAKKNYETFRKLISPKTKLWAVVKSNAYGHGIVVFSKLAQKLGVDGFCVDSLVEGIRLRKEGIKKPILVLGPTLPGLFNEAAKKKITITISSFDALRALAQMKNPPSAGQSKPTARRSPPEFHIKIDTGMHRQGFYIEDLPKVIKLLNSKFSPLSSRFKGIYTHFASAKDTNYPTYTEKQFSEFQKAIKLFEQASFNNLIKHCAATGGTLIDPKYHLDAVRIGIGLYGLWPSKELEVQLGRKIKLHPILSWRAVVGEVKKIKAGDYVGYDLTERVRVPTKIAVLPVGYWHGLPRALSGSGEVLINDKFAKILGRVSMDLTVVGPVYCRTEDVATLIGRDGKNELLAANIADKLGASAYELLTRLNPLMERIVL